MSSWFNTLLGGAQAQNKPENHEPQNTEIVIEEMMESVEYQDDTKNAPKNSKNQLEVASELHSQSSNSSGFQQIIIQDCHSQQNPQKQTNAKLSIPKSNYNFNCMIDTMNFDEDLNASVRQTNFKYVPKSNYNEQDLMSFSGVSSNEQSFSQLSRGSKDMEDSFSNLKLSKKGSSNRESFSDLQQQENQKQQPRDLLRITQKPDDDSDNEDDIEKSRMEQSKKAQDQVEDNLSFWNLPSRKPSNTENQIPQVIPQTNLESFSELESSYNMLVAGQSLEKLQNIDMEESQDRKIQALDVIDIIYQLDRSEVAPAKYPIKKIQQKYNQQTQKKSPAKTTSQNTPQKGSQESKKGQIAMNANMMGQSFILTPASNTKKPQKQNHHHKNEPQKLQPVKVHSKDCVHFVRYRKNQDKLLNERLLQSLTQFFLIQNIMLPIFNVKLINDIDSEMACQRKSVKQVLFKYAIELYFRLLDKRYPELLNKFFQTQKSHKSQLGTISSKNEDTSTLIGNFYKKIFEYLKLNHYSKAQMLKKTLQAELAFVTEYKQSWLESWSDSDPNMEQSIQEKEFEKRNSMDMDCVKTKESYLLQKIGELQVLISFEKSEMYCDEKLKEKMQENIWKERKKKLIEDRNFFITNFYQNCYV